MPKITIIVGAGATCSEAIRLGTNPRPPLDRGFFSRLQANRPSELLPIRDYMADKYSVDVVDPEHDRLESVMSVIYTDIRHSGLASEAAKPFQALIRSINAELTASTNKMKVDLDGQVYRIIQREAAYGVRLEDIALVTFNYDLQIEKALEALERDGITSSDGVTLNFPYCYHLPALNVTSPTGNKADLFAMGDGDKKGVAVYKLHGSLNWYSSHNSKHPSIDALLRTTRKIRITRRRSPNVGMTVAGSRRTYAFPVVIPPVLNKSAILPTGFGHVWKDAEAHLACSTHVIVFGYSCPAFDLEAANLIARSLRGSRVLRTVSIIDPNPDVMARYASLSAPKRIAYFRDAETFLS